MDSSSDWRWLDEGTTPLCRWPTIREACSYRLDTGRWARWGLIAIDQVAIYAG